MLVVLLWGLLSYDIKDVNRLLFLRFFDHLEGYFLKVISKNMGFVGFLHKVFVFLKDILFDISRFLLRYFLILLKTSLVSP